ncbi:Vitamin K epoxide reductase family protein [Botrimarina colliarenosi]|uniref:Vitamin K epoxide reductase family protein n=1 Tax=Botrimarina colliarenosi TaxID=2528001 RepID=A0A5C6AIZ9_9BACT|nr:vitamin K epoxide reductase family protein [Botrimarina colliarenosi]TWT99447.1 Vitamin K epoxide reductase family protein [Botrimarina colliarenosi]
MSDKAAPVDELNRNVPPYRHNPSGWGQRIPICLLAFIAAVISVHLSLYQWGFIENAYDPLFDDGSNRVLKSDTALRMYGILGIHDAALGVLAYLGDAILGLAGSTRRWQYRPWLVLLFGIDVIPLGMVSLVLVVFQAFVVGSWCFLCLVTAAISLILIYWAWDEVRVSLAYLLIVWKEHHNTRLLWDAFCGLRDDRLDAAGEKLLSREAP